MTRRVLVTGGAGFIGSHVVEALLLAGDDVHALDDLSRGQVTNLPAAVPLHVLDIGDASVTKLLRELQFDAIVHCAAQTNVMRSITDPDLDRRINIDGLQRRLDAAADSRIERFVFISSGGAVYGETNVPADEGTSAQPDNPYGQHKLSGERMLAASPIPGVTLRPSNVYGRRQRSDAEGGVIAIFAERLAAGEKLRIYGDGEQERDFVHVSDVVDAVLLMLDDHSMCGVWNVGTGRATTVNEVAATMLEAFGAVGEVEHLPPRGEVRRSCLDVSKLIATGRWRPRIDLVGGVADLARSARVGEPS